jgi:predicted RNA-binding Zn-ribbon protein involved in translation (DUF1610 family)
LNLSENLSNSFDYVKKLFSDIGRLVILVILDIIPIVNWIVLGYAARVLRESPASAAPPKLERYGELFVDGAKVFFASLIYMLIPGILFALGVFSFFTASMGFGGFGGLGGQMIAPAITFSGTGIALILVGIVLAFVLLLVLGAGLAHMIKTGKFGKAFAFGEIFAIIRGIGWGKYIGWAVLVVIIAIVVGGVAGAIPVVGWIISLIVSPVLSVFIFRSLGLLYNDGVPPEMRMAAPVVTEALVCSSCGTPLQSHQKFCPNCGAAAPAPPTSPPPAVVAGETRFCISCGARIPTLAKFCGTCGTKQA